MASYERVGKLALMGFVSGLISCVLASDGNGQAPQVAQRTVILQQPIGRFHQITVRGSLGGEGQIALDANRCTITQFGDPGICTKIAVQQVPIKLVQLRIADPTGAGRRLFRLDGELPPTGARYFLVVPRRGSGSHRLVVDLGQDVRRVMTLEPIPSTDPGVKPRLCKNAKYRSLQRDGKVTIFAQGEHPTAGWKVAFEQLPIRIFPPQYRLVCVKPSGIVAQVITPFEVAASFSAGPPVEQVIVHDADGQHKVPVQK